MKVCGVCGKEEEWATPLYKMCHSCYNLYQAAVRPKISLTGHPMFGTYWHDPDHEAIRKWEVHLREHGFVKKRGRWVKE